jgi:pimeloyl-ACP methyl ester carboxylesterase
MFFHRRQTERHFQEACSRPAAETLLCQGFASAFVTAQDGLTLHVRRYGSRHASAHSVVCLPGLARTAADFHPLATALAADPANPRLVLAVDYRGLQRTGIRCRGRWPTETGLRERRPLFLRGLISHVCAADQLARARRSAISRDQSLWAMFA